MELGKFRDDLLRDFWHEIRNQFDELDHLGFKIGWTFYETHTRRGARNVKDVFWVGRKWLEDIEL